MLQQCYYSNGERDNYFIFELTKNEAKGLISKFEQQTISTPSVQRSITPSQVTSSKYSSVVIPSLAYRTWNRQQQCAACAQVLSQDPRLWHFTVCNWDAPCRQHLHLPARHRPQHSPRLSIGRGHPHLQLEVLL